MKTKKFLSMILSIALLGSVSVPVFAETIENSAVVSSDSDVKSNFEYSKYEKLILSSYDLIKVIDEENEYTTIAFEPWIKVIELEKRPENISELVGSENNHIYLLITGETPSLERCTVNTTRTLNLPDNYSGEIKYIFDLNKKQIRDYKNDVLIQDLSKSNYFSYYFGKNPDSMHYEAIYTGEYFMVNETGFKYEDLVDSVSVLYGDINSDKKIDLTDLSELSLAVLGDSTLSEEQTTAADIDGDGDLTVADLSRLKQYVSNQISSLR